MSEEKKQILQKLTDELGHITLIADWAERQRKAIDDGTFGDVPAAPAEPVTLPEATAEAPADVPVAQTEFVDDAGKQPEADHIRVAENEGNVIAG